MGKETQSADVSKLSAAEKAGAEQVVPPHESISESDNTHYEPLFDGEAVSVAELGGEEEIPAETPEEEAEEEKAEPKEEDAKEEETQESSSEDKDDDGKEKPPPGYVPHQALHEQREMNKELKQELQDLRSELREMRESKSSENSQEDTERTKGDFKVLSDEEFEELLEDDPFEAIKYERRLQKHKEKEKAVNRQDLEERAAIEASVNKMREAVPELFNPDSTMAKDLSEFAAENGFDVGYLQVMTDPATRVVLDDPKGGGRINIPLTDGAVALTTMLNNLYQKAKGMDADKVRAEIRKELEAEFAKKEKELTQQIVKKFKSDPTSVYRDIGEVPGGDDSPASLGKNLTEAQFAKLSPEEQERYLGAM